MDHMSAVEREASAGAAAWLVLGAELGEQVGGALGEMGDEDLAVLLDVLLGLVKGQRHDVEEGIVVVLEVLQQDLEEPVMGAVLAGQEERVALVAGLAAHLDGGLHLKVELVVGDEGVEALLVL